MLPPFGFVVIFCVLFVIVVSGFYFIFIIDYYHFVVDVVVEGKNSILSAFQTKFDVTTEMLLLLRLVPRLWAGEGEGQTERQEGTVLGVINMK